MLAMHLAQSLPGFGNPLDLRMDVFYAVIERIPKLKPTHAAD